jgi:hypothetical protein
MERQWHWLPMDQMSLPTIRGSAGAPIVQRDGGVVARIAAEGNEDGAVDVQPRQFDRLTAPRSGEAEGDGQFFVVGELVKGT